MDLHLKNQLDTGVTVVSNEFINHYMAEANGEYIKVYLFLLCHYNEAVTVETIADALNHTEADVKRAVSYWKKQGVLTEGQPVQSEQEHVPASTPVDEAAKKEAEKTSREKRSHCTAGEIEAVSKDDGFCQLIYIAQKYMDKLFTPKECEVFAYLYGTLKMPAELLEYLVEYCAQNGHTSIRYIEQVALNWHEKKLLTVEEAKAYSRTFSKDSFAVMKALGLTGRSPADVEYNYMDKWYREYGFTKEIVVEACNRTMQAIGKPQFSYVDRILAAWKKAGIRTPRDIVELDKAYQEEKKSREQKASSGRRQTNQGTAGKKPANRFHNLEEHGYDYDKMVWSMINPGSEEQ